MNFQFSFSRLYPTMRIENKFIMNLFPNEISSKQAKTKFVKLVIYGVAFEVEWKVFFHRSCILGMLAASLRFFLSFYIILLHFFLFVSNALQFLAIIADKSLKEWKFSFLLPCNIEHALLINIFFSLIFFSFYVCHFGILFVFCYSFWDNLESQNKKPVNIIFYFTVLLSWHLSSLPGKAW